MTFDLNIHKFLDKFNENYDFLYDNKDNVAGYSEAVSFGDTFISDHADFVGEFVTFRGDILSSDREVAAFAFTLLDFIEIG